MSKLFIAVIKFYRKNISSVSSPHCRFIPTCSQYALTAFERYGAMKGLYLTMKRIIRCNPFCKGGYDPVP